MAWKWNTRNPFSRGGDFKYGGVNNDILAGGGLRPNAGRLVSWLNTAGNWTPNPYDAAPDIIPGAAMGGVGTGGGTQQYISRLASLYELSNLMGENNFMGNPTPTEQDTPGLAEFLVGALGNAGGYANPSTFGNSWSNQSLRDRARVVGGAWAGTGMNDVLASVLGDTSQRNNAADALIRFTRGSSTANLLQGRLNELYNASQARGEDNFFNYLRTRGII